MKNRTFFLGVALIMCLLLLSSAATAQFTQVWKVNPGTWPIMLAGDNNRGAALNRTNGHYLVTNRALPRIYVFNASTGALLDSMTMTGVSGGTVALQDIEVTADGVVYGSNLITQSGADTVFKIYRWANDNNSTVPTVAYSGRPQATASFRLGDAFDVAGTGAGTVIYVGGNASATNAVQVFTTADGLTFSKTGSASITGQDAGAGIAQITPGGDFYTSRFSSGQPIRLYNSTGGRKDLIPTTVNLGPQADLAYLEAGGHKWIAAAPESTSGGRAVLLDVTYGPAGALKVGTSAMLGTTTNSNASGDIEMEYNAADSTITLYALADNNGIAAFKTGNLLIANLPPFVGNVRRTQYVPMAMQPDTVYADVQDNSYIVKDSVKLFYSVDGTLFSPIIMTRTSGDSVNGTYRGIIPGSNHGDGKRIAYFVTASDNVGARVVSATSGYFAGTTKMTLTGPRAIDTAGAALWKTYGIRINGVCIQEDSITQKSRLDIVLQDDKGGMTINKSGSGPIKVLRGRVYTVEGVLDQFNGKIQITTPAGFTNVVVIDNGPGVLPKPRMVTAADLVFEKLGEDVENTLVAIKNLRFTSGSNPWPVGGATGSALNLIVTDNGTDTTLLRTAEFGGQAGTPKPREPFTAIGVAGQFGSSTAFKVGYQIITRDTFDIIPEVKVGLKDTSVAVIGAEVTVPALVGNINGLKITGFNFDVLFDSTALQFVSATNAGTLSAAYSFVPNIFNAGSVRVVASGSNALVDSGAIFNLKFKVLKTGSYAVNLTGSFNEGFPVAVPVGGVIIGTIPPTPRQIVSVKNAKMTVGITNVGHIGALNGYQDQVGFMFKNINALYEGSLIMGNAKNRVPNAARFGAAPSWNPGFRHRAPIIVDTNGTKIETVTAFDDSNYTNPLGIEIYQSTALDTASGKDGYLILGYDVVNKTTTAINNFRIGSFFDFDLTAAGDADRGGILKDSTNQITGVNSGNPFKIHLAYMSNGTTFTGVVPLTQTVFAGGRIAIGPDEVYSGRMVDSNKYAYISTFRPTNTYTDGGTANDLSIFSSVGPYTIAGNDTASGAFAIVVGSSLTELLANARAAQTAAVKEYGVTLQILTGVGGQREQLPTAFALDQNYPNPFNPATTIRFALPSDANVSLKVYDMLGREIRSLVTTNMNAGFHQVVWDGRNNLGSSVATGMYIYRIEAGTFISTKKMMLMK